MNRIIVTSAEYLHDLSLKITFNNNTERVLDFTDFFKKHPHPQYNSYKNKAKFKKFQIRSGNIIWGKHADLSFPIQALYSGNLEYCD